jgi:glutaredoxin-like protein
MENNTIKVYGTIWCGDCFRAKRLLNHHKIEFEWINIDLDRDGKDFVRQVNHGSTVVPTIIFADGTILSEPSNTELLSKLGIINEEKSGR